MVVVADLAGQIVILEPDPNNVNRDLKILRKDDGGNSISEINFGSHANNAIRFGVPGGPEYMRIHTNGRIGIGTNNPEAPLHIPEGGLQIGTSPTPANNFYIVNEWDIDPNSRTFRLYHRGASTHLLTVASVGGHVGIGTKTPKNKLDVQGSAVIGTAFAGITPAPSDGLLVDGSVGIGKLPGAGIKLDVNGMIAGDGANITNISHGNLSNILVANPTSTDATTKKHVTDNQTKAWQDHVNSKPGNPHLTTAADVNALPTAGGTITGGLVVNGNVGIGTTSLGAKLHVAGNLKLDIGEGLEFLGNNDYFGTNLDARIFRMIDQNGTNGEVDGGLAIEGFTPTDNKTKTIMAIRGNGKVGIGTSSPWTPLHIVSQTGAEAPGYGNPMAWGKHIEIAATQMWGLSDSYGSLCTWDSDSLFVGLKNEGSNRKDSVIVWGDDSNDMLRFMFAAPGNPAPAPVDVMRLTPAGDVTIKGDININQSSFVSLHYGNRGKLGATPTFNPDNNQNGLWLEASTDGYESGGIFMNGNTMCLWSPGDNDLLRIYDEDDFSEPKLVIKGNGRLNKLDVDNNFDAIVRAADFKLGYSDRRGSPGRALVDYTNSTLVLNYNGDWTHTRIDGDCNLWSSREVKENIFDLSSQKAFEILNELNPVEFNFKTDKEKERRIGFIAETVPALVGTPDTKAVNPLGIISVLTKVVKEQQRAILALQKGSNRSTYKNVIT